LRQPELTILARVSVFSDVVVLTIFDVSENIVDENKIRNLRIFNTGETPHTVLQRPEKIVAHKGKHEFGAI
jgi:hypothetical protein